MRIVHYIRSVRLSDGGVVRAVLDMCSYQARAGAEVVLACFDAPDAPWNGRPSEPRVVLLPPPGRVPRLSGPFGVAARALVRDADVLHLHVIWDPVSAALAKAAACAGKPYIQSTHGMLIRRYRRQKRLKKWLYMALIGGRQLRGAACIAATAHAELDDSAGLHRGVPGTVIPLIVDLDAYRSLPGAAAAEREMALPLGAPRLLHLSLMLPTKRPGVVIETCAALRDRGLEASLVMAGPASPDTRRELGELVDQRRLGDRVSFPGMVTDLKASLFQACDLFLLPSKAENFALAAFEALACGTPVLTTDATATWRELEASGGGRVVPAFEDDAKGFIDEAERLARNPAALQAMGEAGRRWVSEALDPVRVVRLYIDMYQRAIDGKR